MMNAALSFINLPFYSSKPTNPPQNQQQQSQLVNNQTQKDQIIQFEEAASSIFQIPCEQQSNLTLLNHQNDIQINFQQQHQQHLSNLSNHSEGNTSMALNITDNTSKNNQTGNLNILNAYKLMVSQLKAKFIQNCC